MDFVAMYTYIHTYMIQFKIFFSETSLFCSPRLHIVDQKYSKNSNIMKYYYNLK